MNVNNARNERQPLDWYPPPIFVTHHKTGTYLGIGLSNCIIRESRRFDQCQLHDVIGDCPPSTCWNGDVPGGCKVVHLIRRPYAVIKSSYLYTSKVPSEEGWMDIPLVHSDGTPLLEDCPITPECGLNRTAWYEAVPDKPKAGEGLTSYYNRVSDEDGLVADMLDVSKCVVDEMEQAVQATMDDQRVLTLSLEGFYDDFNGSLMKAFNHLGFEPTNDTWSCVEREDPSEYTGSHSTAGTITTTRSNQIDTLIEQIDGRLSDYDVGMSNNRFSNSQINSIVSSLGDGNKDVNLEAKYDAQRRAAWLEKMA